VSEPLPSDCPRFDRCAAPVCPLDPEHARSTHLPGEPVCFYLRATAKPDAPDVLGTDPVFHVALARAPAILRAWPDIGRRVRRAATSRLHGANLRASAAAR